MKDAEDIAKQLCTPLPGGGPLAASLENVIAAVQIAQQDTLSTACSAIMRAARNAPESAREHYRSALNAVNALRKTPTEG